LKEKHRNVGISLVHLQLAGAV